MKFIDMHTHTTASDGVYSPSRLVDYAIKKGLSGIAITDHDTVDGIEEALEHANKYKDFIVVPGVELSTQYRNEEIHILGYMIDYKMNCLLELLENLQDLRTNRAIKIINKLKGLGFEINYEGVLRFTKASVIGRPHIARFLIEKGYTDSIGEAFQNYLGKGCVAYVAKEKLTPSCAIDIIKKAGGISVIAHPGLLKEPIAIIEYLIDLGVDGIEVYHSEHSLKESMQYLEIAKNHNLLITGGSDFHYPPQNNGHNGDLGSIKIPLKDIKPYLSF